MANAWKCGPCDQMVTTQYCQGCGGEYQPPPAPVASGPAPREENDFDYCRWTTEGRACLLLASSWTSPYGTRDNQGKTIKPGYCHWHVMCLEAPGLADDFDMFDKWRQDLLDRHVCTQYSHHPAPYVWRAMQGHSILDPAQRRLIERCPAYDCWAPETLRRHYVKLDKAKQREEEEAQRVVRPAEAAAKVREIERVLTHQMTLPTDE